MPEDGTNESGWTLLTNHGAALVHIAEHPDSTIRQVADAIGVQERAAARILRQLRDAGYLHAERIGRRNTYQLELSLPLRHQVASDSSAVDLLSGLVDTKRWTRASRARGTKR